MVFVQPAERASDQEIADFITSEIEDIRAPVELFALPGVGMFIQRRTVETPQRKRVFREMRRHPVEDHPDPVPVHGIDEISEILRRAVPCGRRIKTAHLIAPRLVQRMFAHRQQFHMGITHFLHISRQRIGEFAVSRKFIRIFGILFRGQTRSAPRPQMHFVNRNGTFQNILMSPLIHPLGIVPFERVRGRDPAGIAGTFFGPLRIRVEFGHQISARGQNLVFVEIAGTQSGDEQCPHAGIAQTAHHVAASVPAVEFPDHGDALRIGSPHGEQNAGDFAHLPDMRPHHIVDPAVFTLVEEVKIHFTDPGQEMVGVFGNKAGSIGKMFFDRVVEMLFATGKQNFEQPFRTDFPHGENLFPDADRHGHGFGIVNADRYAVLFGMHAEDAVRVAAFSGQQILICRPGNRIRLFHGIPVQSFSGGVRKSGADTAAG